MTDLLNSGNNAGSQPISAPSSSPATPAPLGEEQHSNAPGSIDAASEVSHGLALARPPPPRVAPAMPSPVESRAAAPSPSSVASSPASAAASAAAAAPAAVPAAAAPLPLDLPPIRELPLIKLGKTAKERTYYEQLGDLFSLIVTTEHLERAYVRDAITEQAYTAACQKLIAQYKTLRESLGAQAPELDAFAREYQLEDARAGINRLNVGVPATVVHGDSSSAAAGGPDGDKATRLSIFAGVQAFITMMDALKLNLRAVDELHPTLTELVDAVNKVPLLPPTHESRAKPLAWLVKLSAMKAHEELAEEDIRQMSFELDAAYNAFHRFVQGK